MSKVNLETLRASSLEKRLSSSIFNKHYKVMDSYIGNNLRKKGDNFFIPTIQTLTEMSPELEKELLELYHRKFPMGDLRGIDYDIMLLQASVFDGLVVGLNTEKDGDFQIYTANTGAIFGIDSGSKFNIEKTLELNRKRIVHAVRIDIEYTSEEGFTFKPVSLNKNTNLHIVDLDTFEGRFHLVPYIAIQRSMAFFKEMLDDRRVLEVRQDKGEVKKIRYITYRGDVLAKYCDNEAFAKSLKPSFFPLKGFFYAPVVGANSFTVGVTRVDLLDIYNVKNTTSLESIKKPSSGVESVVKESSILAVLTDMYENDLVGYQRIVDMLPNSKGLLTGAVTDVDKGVPRPMSIVKYMYGLNTKERELVESYIPGLSAEVEKKKAVLNKYEELNPSNYSIDEIKHMLRTGVYKFVIRKKNCNYSTITATNSEELLSKLYSEDYFGKYESFGVRLYKLESLLRSVKDLSMESLVPVFNYCGFPSDIDTIKSVLVELRNNGFSFTKNKTTTKDGNNYDNTIHGVLADLLKTEDEYSSGKTTRRSSSNESIILVRKCFASMTSSGSVDFYRYLDMSKVVSMFRVG